MIAHNTAIADAEAFGYNLWPPPCYEGLFVHNNILEGQTLTVNHGKSITCTPNDAAFFRNVRVDGNLHWQRDDSAPLIQWGATSFDTLQAFTAATGQEANGVELPPVFAVDGVSPAVGSAMRDRAVSLVGINDRAADGMPDIGAVEALP